jgi:hypothetical protein
VDALLAGIDAADRTTQAVRRRLRRCMVAVVLSVFDFGDGYAG